MGLNPRRAARGGTGLGSSWLLPAVVFAGGAHVEPIGALGTARECSLSGGLLCSGAPGALVAVTLSWAAPPPFWCPRFCRAGPKEGGKGSLGRRSLGGQGRRCNRGTSTGLGVRKLRAPAGAVQPSAGGFFPWASPGPGSRWGSLCPQLQSPGPRSMCQALLWGRQQRQGAAPGAALTCGFTQETDSWSPACMV